MKSNSKAKNFSVNNHLIQMEKERKIKNEKFKSELNKISKIKDRFKPKHVGKASQSAIERLATPTVGQLKATYQRYGTILERDEPEMLNKFFENLQKIENDDKTAKSFRNLKMKDYKPTVEFRAKNPKRPGKIEAKKPPTEPIWEQRSGTADPERLKVLAQPRLGLLLATLEDYGATIERGNAKLKQNLDERVKLQKAQQDVIDKNKHRKSVHSENKQENPVSKSISDGTPIKIFVAPRINLLKATIDSYGEIMNEEKKTGLDNYLKELQAANNYLENHRKRHKEEISEKVQVKKYSANEWNKKCSANAQPKLNYMIEIYKDYQHLFSDEKLEKFKDLIENLHDKEQEKPSVQRYLQFCQPEPIWKVKEARHPDRAEILCLPRKTAKMEEPREMLKPEDLEERMRKKFSRQKLVERQYKEENLLAQIEKKVNNDLLDEVFDKLMEKLPKMIVQLKFPFSFSNNAKKLFDTACKNLTNYSKCPTNDLEVYNYCNFASIISENIISLLHNSLEHSAIKSKKVFKPLKTMQNNQHLLEIAEKIVEQNQIE